MVEAQLILNSYLTKSLNDQTTPKKPGYTFDGWYNGTEEVENGTQITKPMTLKAHWTPEKVSYTVIHWWENADDNGYSFHESETKKGLTGSETEAVAKSYTVDGKNIFGESVKDKVFTASTISQKTIKGDGSTIVNVYYKRKRIQCILKNIVTLVQIYQQSLKNGVKVFLKLNGLHMMEIVTGKSERLRIMEIVNI